MKTLAVAQPTIPRWLVLFACALGLGFAMALFGLAAASQADVGGPGDGVGGGGGVIEVRDQSGASLGTVQPGVNNPVNAGYPSQGGSRQGAPVGFPTFNVGCSSWQGAGAWRPSSGCDMTPEQVVSASPASPSTSWGTSPGPAYRQLRTVLNTLDGVRTLENNGGQNIQSCAPRGEISAYAQTWSVHTYDVTQTNYTYRYNQYIDGGIWIRYGSESTIGEGVQYFFMGCVYPQPRYDSRICFWNYDGDSYYSNDRTRAAGSWEFFRDRPAQANDPRPPTGGSGTTPPSCDRSGTVDVSFRANTDKLGYYRISVTWTQRVYNNTQYIAWGNQVVYSTWAAQAASNGGNTGWYAYSCRPAASNVTEGSFRNQGSLPNRDNGLNPANCPQNTWQCEIATPTTIGLDRTAINNGSLNPRTPSTVLRNGTKIPLTWSTVAVIDQTGGGRVDVTNGNAGPGVRNLSNIEYQTSVAANSTPFWGSDPNGSEQYFRYYTNNNANDNTREPIGGWRSNANQNVDRAISFTWASDSGRPFVMERRWRVTGEFLVTRGGSIGSDGTAGANQGFTWLAGTYECQNYVYQNGTRISTGPLIAQSNQTYVVRSVVDPNNP